MSATSQPDSDPLAALPLLREAGVSVYWQALEGRTAWIADPDTREVWVSRAVPRELVLRCLIDALAVLDAAEPGPAGAARPRALRLVHSGPGGDESPGATPRPRVVGVERAVSDAMVERTRVVRGR